MKLSEPQRWVLEMLALPGREIQTAIGFPPGSIIELIPEGKLIHRGTFGALHRRRWIQWHRRSRWPLQDHYIITPAGRKAQEEDNR